MAYASRKLLPAETRYATIERGCLTVKWAIRYFCYYLMGSEFQLAMDHAPLRWLGHAQAANAHITHWALALQL